jgi:DNA-binding transcriptional LysR family regulator
MLEKGRQLLKRRQRSGKAGPAAERGLGARAGDRPRCLVSLFALLPLIAEFYAQNPQTRLNFSHHTLAGSWEELTHHGADIILGAINEPPTSAEWSWQTLGALDNIFVVAPAHPLAEATQPLTNKQLSLHRAVVIRDSARYCHPLNSNLLDEQPQIGVDDFASKVELLCAGLGCGFLPRHIARPWLEKGESGGKASPAGARKISPTWPGAAGMTGWLSAGGGRRFRDDLLSQLYVNGRTRRWRR